jgi:ethylene receptor
MHAFEKKSTYRLGVGASSATAPHLHFNGLRILLADSDAMSMEVTRKLLERLGCQVLPVSSGADCLSLLGGADPSFELVVLDLSGHGGAGTAAAMDGFEVALRIRELSSTCWLLVLVAVEASGVDDSVRDMCRRAGVDGLIHKPITLPALGAQLQRVLQNN